MKRNNQGFTLVEIVVVLLLISIIAATFFTRSITFPQVSYTGQVEKIQNHIRYAKALAMKQSITDELWGISCADNHYWLFHIADRYHPPEDAEGDVLLSPITMPGEKNEKVSLSAMGVTLSPFSLYFDKYGRPFEITPTQDLTSNMEITIHTADAQVLPKKIVIFPETGFITTQ